ncbi:unnamed protein product [Prorocentrum cordatum]|uniref:Uncharacterized protein n=1 Tax=Prorocentrum cordatum TaxID=2364126 RepID=A0ABN9VBL9_9DINO|nr:unnamed protein product [Polarella glacialis]
MDAGAPPWRAAVRRLRRGLARAAPRRLGPDGEIDAWTLSFADPRVESGFLSSGREQLRSSFRRVVVVILCGAASAVYFHVSGVTEHGSQTQEAHRLKRLQVALQVACYSVELSVLLAAIALSGHGLLRTRGMEAGATVAMMVCEVHTCINIRHYIARTCGYEDPSAVYGVDLAGSDAPFLLGLTLCIAGSGVMVRWKLFVPIALASVLEYVAAAYLLGSPDTRMVSTNLLFFACIVLVMCSGKRSSEIQARLLHLSYLREKGLRVQAEFSLECMQDRADLVAELGSSVAGASSHSPGGAAAPLRPGSPRSASSEPAASAAARPGQSAVPQGPGGLPLEASVWVEGQAGSCLLRDLGQGQRVLCYDTLGRSVRYAHVLEKQVKFLAAAWTNVGLDDGTQLAMTVDQPVQTADGGEVVRAADLSPGVDHVVVHRVATAPVAVKEVSRQPEAGSALGWVHLAVRQPERHLVLVGGPGAGSPQDARSMAVCSAGLCAGPHGRAGPEQGAGPRVARARSVPPQG